MSIALEAGMVSVRRFSDNLYLSSTMDLSFTICGALELLNSAIGHDRTIGDGFIPVERMYVELFTLICQLDCRHPARLKY